MSARSWVRRRWVWVGATGLVMAGLGVGLVAAVQRVRDAAAHSSDL